MMYHFYESYGEESSGYIGSENCCHESQSEVPDLRPICIICQCEKISALTSSGGKYGEANWLIHEYQILKTEVIRKFTSPKTDGFSHVDAIKIIDTTAGMLGISAKHSEELFPLITEVVFNLCQSLRPDFLKYIVSSICKQVVAKFSDGVANCLEVIIENRTCLEILKDLPNLQSEIVPKLLDSLTPSSHPKVILSLVRTMKTLFKVRKNSSSSFLSFYPRLVYVISEIFNNFHDDSEHFYITELLEFLNSIFASESILVQCLRDKLDVFSNLFISFKKLFVAKRTDLSKLALRTMNTIFYSYNNYTEKDNCNALNPNAFEESFILTHNCSFNTSSFIETDQSNNNFSKEEYSQSEVLEELPLPLVLFQSDLIHFIDHACTATDEKLFISIIRFYLNLLSITPTGADNFQNSLEAILRVVYLKSTFTDFNGEIILDFCHAVIPKVLNLKPSTQYQFVAYFEKQCHYSEIDQLLSSSHILNYCKDESLRPKIWKCLQITEKRWENELLSENCFSELRLILNIITAYIPYCEFHAENEDSSESLDKRFLPFIIKERFFGSILELIYYSNENIFSEYSDYGHVILRLLKTFRLEEFLEKSVPDDSETQFDAQTMEVTFTCMNEGELFLDFMRKTLEEEMSIKLTSAVYQILLVFLENEDRVNIGDRINLSLSCMHLSSLFTSNEHLNCLTLLFEKDFHSAFIKIDEPDEKEEFLKAVQGLYVHVQSLILKSSASNLLWNLLTELLSYLKRNNYPSHLRPLVFDPWIPFLFYTKCSGIKENFDLNENPSLGFIHEWATIFIQLISEIGDTSSREILIGEGDEMFSFARVFKFLEDSLKENEEEDELEAASLEATQLKDTYSIIMNQYLLLKRAVTRKCDEPAIVESQVENINEQETEVIKMDFSQISSLSSLLF